MTVLNDVLGLPTLSMRQSISARAARQYRESHHFNAVGSNQIFYMDVGVWAKSVYGTDPSNPPKTTFGLVCENDILLCSWMNFVEGGYPPAPEYALTSGSVSIPMSAGTKSFFEKAHKLDRGYVVKITRSLKPLTPPNQLIVIFPDMHLHLYRGQSCDRFQMPGERPGELHSLDKELRSLLDVTNECGAEKVHVGDLYEVWESEIFLRMQYRELQLAKRQISQLGGSRLRDDLEEMLQTRKVVPRRMTETFDHYSVRTGSYAAIQAAVQTVKTDGVDFLSYSEICAGIRRAHKDLFKGHDKLFDYQIDGNHDNQRENQYWSQYAEDAYKADPILGKNTSAGVANLKHLHGQIGTADHPIHIEHGHARDWHNNDRDWCLPDHGFDMVYSMCAGFFSAFLGRRTESGGDFAQNYFGDKWTALQNYEMRLAEERRVDEIFDSNQQIRLVIMGHTHGPDLLAAPYRVHFGEANPEYLAYQMGDYWWKTDQQLREEKAEEERLQKRAEEERQKRIERMWDKR